MTTGLFQRASALALLLLAASWPAHATPRDDDPSRAAVRGRPDRGAPRPSATPPARSRHQGASSNSTSNAQASSEGGIGVGSQGQSLSVDSHARGAASTAIAPALSGSNDTCMGSASVGAAGMAFGLSLGTTYTDDNCMMLKNARELWNMGFRDAALARMCMDERNRQALEASGIPCPTPPADKQRKQARESADAREGPAPARQESPWRNAISASSEPDLSLR